MVRTVTFVDKFQDETASEKTFTKKSHFFFWFQVGDIKILDIFTESKSSYERHRLQ